MSTLGVPSLKEPLIQLMAAGCERLIISNHAQPNKSVPSAMAYRTTEASTSTSDTAPNAVTLAPRVCSGAGER